MGKQNLSEECKARRREYNRAYHRERMKDPEYRRQRMENQREYRAELMKDPERRRQLYHSHKKWREANSERFYARKRDLRYGLEPGEFDSILESQGGRCAICKTDSPGGKGEWHVDHCHDTGGVRGILCHGCNTGLGLMGDSLETLESAVDYLRRF